jgi:glycosyltransferase involved in cell wall biosynthesis
MPKVSAVIPCYNDGKFLAEAVSSIKNQSYKDIELIIVNDGSTDEQTLQLLSQITDRGEATVLHQENARQPTARNHGIRVANGKWILTLDADDKLDASFVQKAAAVLESQQGIGVVCSYMKCFGSSTKKWRPLGGGVENFLYRNQCNTSALFRKECWETVGGYDEHMIYGLEDWEYWLRIVAAGWEVAVIPEYLFHYRVSDKSFMINETTPRLPEIIDYMVEKHRDLYLSEIKKGMVARKLFDFRKAAPYQFLLKPLTDRLQGL